MSTIAPAAPSVLVDADGLIVVSLTITDSDAIGFVTASDDPELALIRCVEMGARVLRLANATVDTQVVENRFDEMTRSPDRSVDQLADRIDESARGLLDEENGELAAALRTWLSDLTEVLVPRSTRRAKRVRSPSSRPCWSRRGQSRWQRCDAFSTQKMKRVRSEGGAPRSSPRCVAAGTPWRSS
jgi:hypothetical protein